jgi:hypothetical protein
LKSAGLEINCTKITEMKRTAKALSVDEYEIKGSEYFGR